MPSTIESALDALKTRVATYSDLVTVVRCAQAEPNLRDYTSDQLPIGFVILDSKTPRYTASYHADKVAGVDLLVFAEQWDWAGAGATQLIELLETVETAIHRDITNGGYSNSIEIISTSPIRTTHPLYGYRVRMNVRHYQDFRNSTGT